MRLLVLGGTWFLGRAVVGAALGQGHAVTVFHRGYTSDPPGAEIVHGDREQLADLHGLAEAGPWDAVVDVPGVIPAQVRDAARILHPVADRYVFVSTVSAYRHWPAEPVSERSPLHDGDPDADPGSWEWGTGVYGPLKAGAEGAIAREYPPDRMVILRPGVILGPFEYGGRLTGWLRRAAEGGRILAPGGPGDPVRPVDVRDVAAFILTLLSMGTSGIFNVAGPPGRDTMGDLINGCLHETAGYGEVVWVDSDWLTAQGVKQWTELPMWRTAPGTWAIDTSRAETAGLVCRPLWETIADTWAWMTAGGRAATSEREEKHGLDVLREAQLLIKWFNRPEAAPMDGSR
jgi:2'-hydroxyisoflavone reductase